MNVELKKRILSSIVLIPSCVFLILEGQILFNLFLIICFFFSSFEWYRMSKKRIIIYLVIFF